MTSRDRILVALDGGCPDRVPFLLWGVDPYGWMAQAPGYARLAEYVHSHAEAKRQWRPAVSPFYYSQSSVWLNRETISNPDTSEVTTILRTSRGRLTQVVGTVPGTNVEVTVKHLVECDEDLNRFLTIPYRPVEVQADSYLECERQIGSGGIVTHRISDALGLADRLVAPELLYTWAATDPSKLGNLLESLTDRISRLRSWATSRLGTCIPVRRRRSPRSADVSSRWLGEKAPCFFQRQPRRTRSRSPIRLSLTTSP
jgi:hypothetical protein